MPLLRRDKSLESLEKEHSCFFFFFFTHQGTQHDG
jgi:hypothetical protein